LRSSGIGLSFSFPGAGSRTPGPVAGAEVGTAEGEALAAADGAGATFGESTWIAALASGVTVRSTELPSARANSRARGAFERGTVKVAAGRALAVGLATLAVGVAEALKARTTHVFDAVGAALARGDGDAPEGVAGAGAERGDDDTRREGGGEEVSSQGPRG
jgi:hypothetical protein